LLIIYFSTSINWKILFTSKYVKIADILKNICFVILNGKCILRRGRQVM
jgi:hypothetical protein